MARTHAERGSGLLSSHLVRSAAPDVQDNQRISTDIEAGVASWRTASTYGNFVKASRRTRTKARQRAIISSNFQELKKRKGAPFTSLPPWPQRLCPEERDPSCCAEEPEENRNFEKVFEVRATHVTGTDCTVSLCPWSLIFRFFCGKSRSSEPDQAGHAATAKGQAGIKLRSTTKHWSHYWGQLPHMHPAGTESVASGGHATFLHSAASRLLLCQRALLLKKLLLPGGEERKVGMHHAIPSWLRIMTARKWTGASGSLGKCPGRRCKGCCFFGAEGSTGLIAWACLC